MSIENVKAFFKRLEEDEAFRAEFSKNDTLEKGNQDSILKAAAEAGYPFTMDELKQAQDEMKGGELTPEQLEKVAGGAGVGACFIYGVGFFVIGSPDGTVDANYSEAAFCLVIGFN